MSIFINYDDILGECSDSGHERWMEASSISWGTERKISSYTSTQGDRESSNAVIHDLLIVRNMDIATPKLFIESCCGTGKDVIIHLTKTGKGNGSDIFMEYKLKNALISYYQAEAESQDTDRPVEKILISFVDMECKYTPYDEDGNAQACIAVGFDTATNTKK